LRVQWAQEAKKVQEWVEAQHQVIQDIVISGDSSKMDDQLVNLKALEVRRRCSSELMVHCFG
jgi:hypothetical protein